MQISRQIEDQLKNASWIRRMFEEGLRLKIERGTDKVFDYSIGNPDLEPPQAILDRLQQVVFAPVAGSHGYMTNGGYLETREAVARKLSADSGLPYEAADIFMTSGAAGACNVVLKSILNPGDEVIVLVPYFVEYRFYIANHGGVMVPVETDASFLPDMDAIRRAITPRTRVIMINTPNNPTGRVYPVEILEKLEALLAEVDHPIAVLSDEPYKVYTYDGIKQPDVSSIITNTIICNSWSKSLGLPGERVGYVALSPRISGRENLRKACTFANRTLGYLNAPAIWQWVLMETAHLSIDVAPYQARRDALVSGLRSAGYEVTAPDGAFYLFQPTPIADDIAFVQLLAEEGVLTVPGSGFGRPGHMRLSLTIPFDRIAPSIPAFKRALDRVRAQQSA